MLGRAAARAAKSPAQPHLSIAVRCYAKPGKPRTQFIPKATTTKVNKPSTPTSSSTPTATPSVTGPARQTSPGTAIPKDKTWKPQDAIKFGGPAAATGAASAASSTPAPSAAATAAAAAAAPSTPPPIESDYNTPASSAPAYNAPPPEATDYTTLAPLESDHTTPASSASDYNSPAPSASDSNTEPIAQPGPVPGSNPGRAESLPSEAASEELRGPQSSEANTAPSGQPSAQSLRQTSAQEDPSTQSSEQDPPPPTPPLPDLRQGIPSTFFEEFNKSQNTSSEDKATGAEQPDGASSEPGSSGGSGGGGRRSQDSQDGQDYDNSTYETSIDRRRAQLYRYGYLGMLAFFATGALYFSRPFDDDENMQGVAPEHISGWAPNSMWARMLGRWNAQKGYYTEPTFPKLLPDVPEAQRPPYTLVLSLEDLMIHSSWSREHGWRTAKRPGIDYFLRYLSQYYELVLFTSVPVAMADPVVKKLDPFRIIQWPLFREGTKYENGEYVKDLSFLNRPLDKTIIIDTKSAHVKNQPENAIVLPKWTGDPKDPHAKDLVALIPFLEYIASMGTEDTRKVLESFKGKDIPVEFARREALAREAFNKQLAEEKAKTPRKTLGGLLNNALGIKPQPGGMSLDNETTVAEGLAQGKMLSDQIRERGQKEYERLDREIRTNGAKWLKEMEEEEKKFMESQMKDMRQGWFGGLGGSK